MKVQIFSPASAKKFISPADSIQIRARIKIVKSHDEILKYNGGCVGKITTIYMVRTFCDVLGSDVRIRPVTYNVSRSGISRGIFKTLSTVFVLERELV